MKWQQEIWSIRELLDLYEKKKINLAPEYQRNAIWTASAQKSLIDTISAPQPIPNFFMQEMEDGILDMVDGQQRARAIINFVRGNLTASAGRKFDKETCLQFLDYNINVIKITELEAGESIEKFYSLVNSSGLRLNTPELRKAKYFETKFLELCTEMASAESFKSLNLFSANTTKRMNDVELISELLALLHHGRSEKKTKVDDLYKSDITKEEKTILRTTFLSIVEILKGLNEYHPLNKTRYKQRNDLYTLIDFIADNQGVSLEGFIAYYKILIIISEGIRPTQEHCTPLKEYARNCVSQSNSSRARRERFEFMESLFRNQKPIANTDQEEIIQYYGLSPDLIIIDNCWTVDASELEEV